ncbi:hypothetical protein DFH94DRAFT_774092 [Russula ochroleuca]|uniref:Uncharacterized protein n=1 Tax=Russula ochroleuca TaxID=152965 RepID=A0A9P5JY76_9AGAM|nr:hypothetical protein DFH94DRAFT_774092 [Russula ochroleuca]
MRSSPAIVLLLASFVHGVALTGIRNHWSDPYSLRPNPLYPYARSSPTRPPKYIPTSASRFSKNAGIAPSRTWRSMFRAGALKPRQEASGIMQQDLDTRPTPEPTGESSIETTVFITGENDFALLLPAMSGELVSDAERDAKSFCTPNGSSDLCTNRMPDGFITAAALTSANDNSWIQVTGCIDSTKFQLDPNDAGGQFDVRYPNGAQCTFGGRRASFIELVEPALNRFCLRCCSTPNDQINCNSHRDRSGCENAIPGTYDFPELGVSCA